MSSPTVPIPTAPPTLTVEQVGKISERLAPYIQQCHVCDQKGTLQVMPGLVYFKFFQKPGVVTGIGPSVVLICANCANIQFHNVHTLGLAKELGVPPPGEPIQYV
jgi:hypothetical protein